MMRSLSSACCLLSCLLASHHWLPSGLAEDTLPLHIRIDRLVESQQMPPLASRTSDAEFLRRVSLDLVGTIPSAEQARAFIDDSAPEKRRTLIDRLLANPGFARHMTDVFDVMFMERLPAKYITADAWRKYLQDSFAANKPLNVLIREILSADGAEGALRPAARFYLDREAEQHAVTRAVGRVFFGKDLQCAQCHDHPLIADYLQADYHGMLAHLSRSTLFLDKKNNNRAYIAEKAEGETSYFSVFDSDKKTFHALPTVLGGRPLTDPPDAGGESYKVAPADGVRPVPVHSRRATLAQVATCGDCNALHRNLANRLWRHMLGRGLVEPVDMHHAENPPAYPRVLQLLADELAGSGFDLRHLLREIALTDVYQRSCAPPAELSSEAAVATDGPRDQQDHWAQVAEQSDAALDETFEAWQDLQHELTQQAASRESARQQLAKTTKAVKEASAAVEKANQTATPQRKQAGVLAEAATKAKQAAQQLPKDAQLAAAVKTIVQRAEQTQKQLAESEQKLQQANATLQQAKEQQKNAHQALAERQTEFQEVAGRFSGGTAALADRRSEADLHLGLLSQSERHAKQAQALRDHFAAQQSIGQADAQHATTLADLASARQQVANESNKLGPLQVKVRETQQAMDQQQATLQQAEQALAAKRQAEEALRRAVQTTDAALQQLPGDSELSAAASKLQGRLDRLMKEIRDTDSRAQGQRQTVETRRAALATAQDQQRRGEQQVAELTARVDSLKQTANAAQQRTADLRLAADATYDQLVDHWTHQGAVAAIKPLSPEQLAHSAMLASGWIELRRQAARSQWKKNRRDRGAPPVPESGTLRGRFVKQQVEKEQSKTVSQFVALFAGSGGSGDFQATVDQALYLANGGTVRSWLTPNGNNLTARLRKLDQSPAIAEELYLSVLTRHPTDEEVADVAAYLQGRPKDRVKALGEIAWALLTSAEFRFNH